MQMEEDEGSRSQQKIPKSHPPAKSREVKEKQDQVPKTPSRHKIKVEIKILRQKKKTTQQIKVKIKKPGQRTLEIKEPGSTTETRTF